MKYRILVLTAILFTACNLLHAQVQTGKLSGVIIDANNEETLVGALVLLLGLAVSAACTRKVINRVSGTPDKFTFIFSFYVLG